MSLVSFARADFDAALEYIKKHAYMTRDEDGYASRVFTTGVGSSENRERFLTEIKCG